MEDGDANELANYGPEKVHPGTHVFPYTNDEEDHGNLSYLVHRSVLQDVRRVAR